MRQVRVLLSLHSSVDMYLIAYKLIALHSQIGILVCKYERNVIINYDFFLNWDLLVKQN